MNDTDFIKNMCTFSDSNLYINDEYKHFFKLDNNYFKELGYKYTKSRDKALLDILKDDELLEFYKEVVSSTRFVPGEQSVLEQI